MMVDSVRAVQRGDLKLTVRPAWLALSALFVVVTYCVLIASWLYILAGLSGKRVPFLTGARIWFISNLATLLPGRVWGIIQMSAMSAEQGISPVAAGAASVINAAVNIACGMAVGVIAGTGIVASYFGDRAWLAWGITAAAILGVVLLPVLIPATFRFARRRFNARVPDEGTPARLIAVSVIANVASWFLYGAAFLCLTRGILDLPSRSFIEHTAANATSYVVGYLALFVPMGMGVREVTLQEILQLAGMASHTQSVAVSVASRLWLLIIQVVPALIFLAYRRPRHEKDPAAG